jgi:hypothetical protein
MDTLWVPDEIRNLALLCTFMDHPPSADTMYTYDFTDKH